ncbi:MAG: UDP-glucose 6-dehydrogenase [Planctomycetes bacterium GWF2_40_8]|nr:MAG: UDP-glucose 6-dehydrogenase [Planctomycetes bacterium GWF2_40_8]OHB89243.1 MAG: UDP-glucose 6-dehydrogenase [Planctomycetes bacterium RIFCSPHIGHO2_02_FULL_40_12]OHC01524.1 MAG: UDP-glucose 6-dehydrogenase [Planctomycetes bacterium RIFCSPLOWO2_12_FULL_40_19]
MKISCMGSGYVGLVAGTCLADMGNEVTCFDIDRGKINKLNKGIIPIYEPGLKDMFERNIKEKRLRFSNDIKTTIKKSNVIFITVGTPPGKNHEADLFAVKSVAEQIGRNMDTYKVIVNKSTVPVGTAELVRKIIKKNQTGDCEFDVVSNPEFLREGEAVKDFTNPDRIVIGTDNEKAKKIMVSIYRGIARADKPVFITDIKSAEMIKYASNAMLATRISFMNEIAQLCEMVGADIKSVAKGIGLDNRIGPRFLQAGMGYGGSCFPKDVRALIELMKRNKVKGEVLSAVNRVNEDQRKFILLKIKKILPSLKKKTIAVWGLAFKPKTDDIREAPSIAIIMELQRLGAKIRAFDPEAKLNAKKVLKGVTFCNDPYSTVKGCDALVIATEWNEFRVLDIDRIKRLLKQPNIIDGRNIYEPDEMKNAGFNYVGIGR